MVSPVFRKMFSASFAETGMQQITLHDMKAEDFKQFLMAVYPMRQSINGTLVLCFPVLNRRLLQMRTFCRCSTLQTTSK